MINRIISLILIFAHLSTYTYANWYDALKQRDLSVHLDPIYDYSRGRIDIQKIDDQIQVVIHSLDAEKKEAKILHAQQFSNSVHKDFKVDFGQDVSIIFRQTEDGLLIKKLFSKFAVDFVTDQNLNVLDISCREKIRLSSKKEIFLNGTFQFDYNVSLKAEHILIQGHCLLTSAHFIASAVHAKDLHLTILDQLKYDSQDKTTGQFHVNQSTIFAKKLNFTKNTDVVLSHSQLELQDQQTFSAKNFTLIKSTFNFLEDLLYDVDDTSLTDSKIDSSSSLNLISDDILFEGDKAESSTIQVQTIKKNPFIFSEEKEKLSLVQRKMTDNAWGAVFSNLSLLSNIQFHNQELFSIEDCIVDHKNIELRDVTNFHVENCSVITDLFQGINIQKTNIKNSTLLSQKGLFLSGNQFSVDRDSSLFHYGSLYLLAKTFDHQGTMRTIDCDVCFGQSDSRMVFNATGGKIHMSQPQKEKNKARFFFNQGIIKEDSSLIFLNQDATFDIVEDILFLKDRSSIQSDSLCEFLYDTGVEIQNGSSITAKNNKFIYLDLVPHTVGMNEASDTSDQPTSNRFESSQFVFSDPTQKTENPIQNAPKSTLPSSDQNGRIHLEKNSHITSEEDLYVSTKGFIGIIDHSSMNSKQGLMTLSAKKGLQVCQSAITGNIFKGEFLEGTTRFYHESRVNFTRFSADLRDFECLRSSFNMTDTCILKAKKVPILGYNSCLHTKIFDFTVSSSLTDNNPQAHLSHFLFKTMEVDRFRLTYDGFLVNQDRTKIPSLCFIDASGLINFSRIESDYDLVLNLKKYLLNNRLGAAEEAAVAGLSLGAFSLRDDTVLKEKCQHAVEDLNAYFVQEDEKSLFQAFSDIFTQNENFFSKIKTKGFLRIQSPIISSITGSMSSHKKLILQSPDIQFGVGIESKEKITLDVGIPSDHRQETQVVSRYACGPVYLKGSEGILVENNGGRFINSLGQLLAPKGLSIHDSKLSLNYGGRMDISGGFYLDADMFINQTGVKQHAGILGYNHYDIPTTSIPLLNVHGKWLANVRLFHNIGGMIHSEQNIQFNSDRLKTFNNENLILTYHRHYYRMLESIQYERHFLYGETFYTYTPHRVDEIGSWRFVPATISTPDGFEVQAPNVRQTGNIISSKIFLNSTESPLVLGYQQNEHLTHQSVFSGFIPASTDGQTYKTIPVAQLNFPVVVIADKNFETFNADYHFIPPSVDLFQKGLVQHLNTSWIPEFCDAKKLLEKTYTFFKKNQHLLPLGSVVPESADGVYLPIMAMDASILENFPDCALVYHLYNHDDGCVFAPILYIGKNYDLAKLTARADGGIFQRQSENDKTSFNVLLKSRHGIMQKVNLDVQSDIGYFAPFVKAERRTHEGVAVWDNPITYEEHSGGFFQDYTRTQEQVLRTYTELEDPLIFKTNGKILYFSKELTFKGVDVFAKNGQFGLVLKASYQDIDYQIPVQRQKSALFAYDNYVVPNIQSTQLTGHGDVKVLSLDQIVLDGSKIKSGNKIKFLSLNTLIAQAYLESKKGIHLESLRQDVFLISKVLRQTRHNAENFTEAVSTQGAAIGDDVNIVANNGNVSLLGIHVDSQNTNIVAGQHIVDQFLSLTDQSQSESERTTTSLHQSSTINGTEAVSMLAGGGIHLKGTLIDTNLLNIIAVTGGIIFDDALQTYDYELNTSKHKARDVVSISYPARLRAKSALIKTLGGEDVTFVGTKINCPLTKVQLNGGCVHFKAGTNQFYSYRFDDDSDPVMTDITISEKKDTTFVLPEIIGELEIDGALKIIATKVDEASKKYKTKGYYTSIMYAMMDEAGVSSDHSNDNEYWKNIKNLDPELLEYTLAQEVHTYSYKNITRPGPVIMAVVAIAVSLFTMGYGAALAGQMVGAANASMFASGTIGAAMANAAFSCTCAQLAVNTINNNGDPFKSIGQLFHKDSLKNLSISVVTAGIAHGVLDAMGCGGLGAGAENAFEEAAKAKAVAAAIEAGTYVPTATNAAASAFSVQNIATNIKTHVTQSLCGSLTKTAFGEKGAFSNITKDTVISIINMIGAQAIGQADLDKITNKFMHAANAAVLGAATNGTEGAVAAAAGTVAGIGTAETLHKNGTSPQTSAHWGQVVGAVVGGITGDAQNVNIASQAASSAMQSDFLPKAKQSDLQKMLDTAYAKRMKQNDYFSSIKKEKRRIVKKSIILEKKTSQEKRKNQTKNAKYNEFDNTLPPSLIGHNHNNKSSGRRKIKTLNQLVEEQSFVFSDFLNNQENEDHTLLVEHIGDAVYEKIQSHVSDNTAKKLNRVLTTKFNPNTRYERFKKSVFKELSAFDQKQVRIYNELIKNPDIQAKVWDCAFNENMPVDLEVSKFLFASSWNVGRNISKSIKNIDRNITQTYQDSKNNRNVQLAIMAHVFSDHPYIYNGKDYSKEIFSYQYVTFKKGVAGIIENATALFAMAGRSLGVSNNNAQDCAQIGKDISLFLAPTGLPTKGISLLKSKTLLSFNVLKTELKFNAVLASKLARTAIMEFSDSIMFAGVVTKEFISSLHKNPGYAYSYARSVKAGRYVPRHLVPTYSVLMPASKTQNVLYKTGNVHYVEKTPSLKEMIYDRGNIQLHKKIAQGKFLEMDAKAEFLAQQRTLPNPVKEAKIPSELETGMRYNECSYHKCIKENDVPHINLNGKSNAPCLEEGQYYLNRSILQPETNGGRVAVRKDGYVIEFKRERLDSMYHGHFSTIESLEPNVQKLLVEYGFYKRVGSKYKFVKNEALFEQTLHKILEENIKNANH